MVVQFFTHWVVRDLYEPMWSNMFAPSVITLIAVAFSHVRLWRQKEQHHEAQMKAIQESKK